jgi:hypothetical protein
MVVLTSKAARENTHALVKAFAPAPWKERHYITEGMGNTGPERQRRNVAVREALRNEVEGYESKVKLSSIYDPTFPEDQAEAFRRDPMGAIRLLAEDYGYDAAIWNDNQAITESRKTRDCADELICCLKNRMALKHNSVDLTLRRGMQGQKGSAVVQEETQSFLNIPIAQRKILQLLEEEYAQALGYDEETMSSFVEANVTM